MADVSKTMGLVVEFSAVNTNVEQKVAELKRAIETLNQTFDALGTKAKRTGEDISDAQKKAIEDTKKLKEVVKSQYDSALAQQEKSIGLLKKLGAGIGNLFDERKKAEDALINVINKRAAAEKKAGGTLSEQSKITWAKRITVAEEEATEATKKFNDALSKINKPKQAEQIIETFTKTGVAIDRAIVNIKKVDAVAMEVYRDLGKTSGSRIDEISKEIATIEKQTGAVVTNAKKMTKAEKEAAEATKNTSAFNEEQLKQEERARIALQKSKERDVKTDEKKISLTRDQIDQQARLREQSNQAEIALTRMGGANAAAATAAGVHDKVLTELSKRLSNGSNETDSYRSALIRLAGQSGDSVVKFRALANALNQVEKSIQTSDVGFQKVSQHLGPGALPKDVNNYANTVDKVAMVHDYMNKQLTRTGDVVTTARMDYFTLKNTLDQMRATYGEVAWSALEVDKRLGSQIKTVGDLHKELELFQQTNKNTNSTMLAAERAINQTAIRMDELSKVTGSGSSIGMRWAQTVDKQAVASAFLRGEVYKAGNTFLEMGKTAQQTANSLEVFRKRAEGLGDEGKKLHAEFGTSGGLRTFAVYDSALKELATTQAKAAIETKKLATFQLDAQRIYKATPADIAKYTSAIQDGTLRMRDATRALALEEKQRLNTSNLLKQQTNHMAELSKSYSGLLNTQNIYQELAKKELALVDGTTHGRNMARIGLQQLDASLKASVANMDRWATAQTNAGKITETVRLQMQELDRQVKAGLIAPKEAALALQNLVKAQNTVGTSASWVGNFWQGFATKIRGGGEVAVKVTGYMTNLGRSVAQLGAWMPAAMIIQTFMGSIAGAAQAVLAFDQSLKSLKAISGGTTAEVSLLGDEMLRISENTKYSANEIGDGAIYIAQAGFTASESFKVIGAAARGAQGTLESLSIATDLLTTVIRAFGEKAGGAANAAYIMDQLAVAANKSKTNLEGMKIVFNYLGPAANAIGLSLGQTLGAVMALSNAGMRMSTVGTSLRQVFINLEAPNRALQKLLEAQGMSVDDLSVKVQGGLVPVLENLNKALGGNLTNAVKSFSVRAAPAIILLTTMHEHVKVLTEYVNEWGASAKMASTQSESLAITMDKLINKFNAFIIRFTQGDLSGLLKGVLSACSALISVLETLINNGFVRFVAVAASLYAVLDLVYLGGMLAIGMFKNMYTAIVRASTATLTVKVVTDAYTGSVLVNTVALTANEIANASIAIALQGMSSAASKASLSVRALTLATTIFNGVLNLLARNPLVMVLLGLSLLVASIYTLTKREEAYGIAVQKNTVRYSERAASASLYLTKVDELSKSTDSLSSKTESYNALMRQMTDTFPEHSAKLVNVSKDYGKLAEVLREVQKEEQALADESAANAILNIGQQYENSSVKIGIYEDAVKNASWYTMYSVKALNYWVLGAKEYVLSLGSSTLAMKLFAAASANWQLSFKGGVEAIKQAATEGKILEIGNQLDKAGEATKVFIAMSAPLRTEILKSIPAGEYKKLIGDMIIANEKFNASLNADMPDVQRKQAEILEALGQQWVDYYRVQNDMGKENVAQQGELAKKAGEAAAKAAKENGADYKAQAIARAAAEQESWLKFYDSQVKYVEKALSLWDQFGKDETATITKNAEIRNTTTDILREKELNDIKENNKNEITQERLLQKKKDDFAREDRIQAELTAKAELEIADRVYKGKLDVLEKTRAMLSKDDYEATRLQIAKTNSETLLAIYAKELTTIKNNTKEKMADIEKYRVAYLKALDDIRKAEVDKQKNLEDNESKRQSIKDKTRTGPEKSDAQEELYRKYMNRANEEMSKADVEMTRDGQKAKLDLAKEYFDKAKGVIDNIVQYTYDAEGKQQEANQSTVDKQLALLDKVENGEQTLADKKIKLGQDTAAEALKSGADAKTSLDGLITKTKEIQDLMSKEMTVNVGVDKALEDLKRLGELKGVTFDVAITGSGSEKLPISEKIAAIKLLLGTIKTPDIPPEYTLTFNAMMDGKTKMSLADLITAVKTVLTGLQEYMIKTIVPVFLINFEGSDGSTAREWLATAITNVQTKITALKDAILKLIPIFMIAFEGKDGSGSGWVKAIVDRVGTYFETLTNKIDNMHPTYTITVKKVEGNNVGGIVGKMANGGSVPGTGDKDTVPAMLTPGEFVIRKSVVQRMGEGFFTMLNGMKNFAMPKMDMGGMMSFNQGGSVRKESNETFTLNLDFGSAKLPLKVVGDPMTMRKQIRSIERELGKMRLSRA